MLSNFIYDSTDDTTSCFSLQRLLNQQELPALSLIRVCVEFLKQRLIMEGEKRKKTTLRQLSHDAKLPVISIDIHIRQYTAIKPT